MQASDNLLKFEFSRMCHFLNFCFLTLLFLFSQASLVQAQSNDGVGLRPATIEEVMNPGQSKEFTITVSNLSDKNQSYYLYKRDIVGASDFGVPIFADEGILGTEPGVSEWITFETETIDIPAHNDISFNFTITVPRNATPEAYFAGVFVSMQPQKLQQNGLAVGYDVADIISIRVAGKVEEKATIRQFSTDNYINNKSEITFNVRIENNGDTLLKPTGPLIINNMFGKQVDMLIFNADLAGVFPGSTREFTVNWVGKNLGLGSYEAIISSSFGEDGSKQTVSNSVTFWILPIKITIPALGVLLSLLLVIHFIIRSYTNREFAFHQATGDTRRLSRRYKRNGSWAVLFGLVVMFVVTVLFLTILLIIFA